MVVKFLAEDPEHVRVVARGPGIADREVATLCRWVSTHMDDAEQREQVGEFLLARLDREPRGTRSFTFVIAEAD